VCSYGMMTPDLKIETGVVRERLEEWMEYIDNGE
jgi:hypothetical protein